MEKFNRKEYQKDYRESNQEKYLEYQKDYRESNKDKIKLSLEKNKDIIKAKAKKYRDANKEKQLEYQKRYRELNKDKRKELYNLNKDKRKELYKLNKTKINESQKNKRHNDPLYKLKGNIRTMISNLLKNRGFTKKSNTFDIVGCSFGEFILHIESQFLPWMDWDNYGLYNGTECFGWDIDHIEPMAKAITEADVIQLNNYTNLRPLCGYINRVVKRNN